MSKHGELNRTAIQCFSMGCGPCFQNYYSRINRFCWRLNFTGDFCQKFQFWDDYFKTWLARKDAKVNAKRGRRTHTRTDLIANQLHKYRGIEMIIFFRLGTVFNNRDLSFPRRARATRLTRVHYGFPCGKPEDEKISSITEHTFFALPWKISWIRVNVLYRGMYIFRIIILQTNKL